jgi:hypothetical protein
VSHLKQRKEKNCLNCNAIIVDRYCSICGQENLQPQESVWHLITHFFNDITHFDGKFFSSVKYILTKPGFLTAEYVKGRRMSYLNPVRFYVFTSFLFFLILFTFFLNDKELKLDDNYINDDNTETAAPIQTEDSTKGIKVVDKGGLKIFLDSAQKKNKNNANILGKSEYRDRKEFDSLDKLGKVDVGFFKRKLINKQFQLKEKYKNDRITSLNALIDNVVHLTPQILFFTLPFFALILKLLYIRRKKFYYVSHIIFTIHFYIFVYINLLLINTANSLSKLKYLNWMHTVAIIFGIFIFYYAYRAMRNFYEQGRWKTLVKLFILSFFLIFLFTFFSIILFGFSLYNM